MNRLNLTEQGFVDNARDVLDKPYDTSSIFRTRNLESSQETYIVNAHTGTSLGYINDEGRLAATVRWKKEQEEIATSLTIVGLSTTGDVLHTKTTGKLVAFLLFKDKEWYSLGYNSFSEQYEFILVTLDEALLPKKISDSSAFYVESVYPSGIEESKYGDIVVLKNKLTKGYLSKGEKDGCSLHEYPIFRNHYKDEFSTELVTGFTHNVGPMFCKSAECSDLSDNNKLYGEYSGCNMLYWQILSLNEEQIIPQDAKVAATTNPDILLWAFIPMIFVVILIMLVVFYYYF